MKFKNKKTGEIKPAEAREDGIYLYDVLTEQWYKYELDLLAKWWEYYEEPKTFWAISWAGEPEEYDAKKTPEELKNMAKLIGNYFETKEEAEKAVEKPSRYEWANISGEYKRDRSDWVMLCPSCHRKIDMGKEKLCVV